MLPSLVSPTRRNGVTTYFRRYLDTVSNWQTYSDVTDGDEFREKFRTVTTNFFGSRKLKGMSFLLAAHLLQQTTASIASLIVRTAMHGSRLDAYRGITIRKAVLPTLPQSIRDRVPVPALLKTQTERFTHWLEPRATLVDTYLFIEGGRTWHCWTLNATFAPDLKRTLTVLSLVGFPNRMYLFDRPLAYNQAVDLALSLLDPDSVPGYLGGTNELDSFVPFVGLLKLGVYALGWLLVDNTERDEPGPDVDGYDRWTPPPPPPTQPQTPPAGGFYNTGGYYPPVPTTPPAPAGYNLPLPFAAAPQPAPAPLPAWNGTPAPATYPPAQPYNPYPQPAPAARPAFAGTPVTLVAAPVKLKMSTQRPNGTADESWYTVTQDSFIVVREMDGRQTGLVVALQLESTGQGEVRPVPGKWTVVHVQSGYLLGAALPTVQAAQQLAALLAHIDWTRDVGTIPLDQIDQAKRIIAGFVPRPPDYYGNGKTGGG